MMKRTACAVLTGALVLAGLAGCGEKTQVTVYKQGRYQGKADSQPWDNDQYKGDRVAWEKAIKARNNGQNEYLRTAAQ